MVPADGLPGGASIEDVLALIENAVDELASRTTPETLTGWDAPSISRLAEAHTRIRRMTGRLDGVRYTLLPRIEDEGSWRSGGMARTFTTWLRLREGISASTAGKDMTIARRLATALPVTRERLVAGTLGVDHARVMTEVAPTSETRTDALAWLIDTRTGHTTTPEQFVQTVAVDFPDPAEDPDGTRTRELITQVLEGAVTDGTLTTGEGVVLREAGVLNADQFRKVARRFATLTDPDTDDVDDDKAAQGEFLDLSKTFGGYHVAGFLTDEHGLQLTTAINAMMGAPSAEDTRTTTQRRAQGLADVARVVLDTNQASPGAAIAPHLNVTVSWTEFVAQVTRTRDGLCLTCGQTTPGRGNRSARARGSRRSRHRQHGAGTGADAGAGAVNTGPAAGEPAGSPAGSPMEVQTGVRTGSPGRTAGVPRIRQCPGQCPGSCPPVVRCSPRPVAVPHARWCAGWRATARSPGSCSDPTAPSWTSDAPSAPCRGRCDAPSSPETSTASTQDVTNHRHGARSTTRSPTGPTVETPPSPTVRCCAGTTTSSSTPRASPCTGPARPTTEHHRRCPAGDRVGLHRRLRPPHPTTRTHRNPTTTGHGRDRRAAASRRSRPTGRPNLA